MKKVLFITTAIFLLTSLKAAAQTEAYKKKEARYCFVYSACNDRIAGTKILYITSVLMAANYIDPKDSYTAGFKLRNAFEKSYKSEMGDKNIFLSHCVWKASKYQDFSHNDDDTFKSEQDARNSIIEITDKYKNDGYQIRTLYL